MSQPFHVSDFPRRPRKNFFVSPFDRRALALLCSAYSWNKYIDCICPFGVNSVRCLGSCWTKGPPAHSLLKLFYSLFNAFYDLVLFVGTPYHILNSLVLFGYRPSQFSHREHKIDSIVSFEAFFSMWHNIKRLTCTVAFHLYGSLCASHDKSTGYNQCRFMNIRDTHLNGIVASYTDWSYSSWSTTACRFIKFSSRKDKTPWPKRKHTHKFGKGNEGTLVTYKLPISISPPSCHTKPYHNPRTLAPQRNKWLHNLK